MPIFPSSKYVEKCQLVPVISCSLLHLKFIYFHTSAWHFLFRGSTKAQHSYKVWESLLLIWQAMFYCFPLSSMPLSYYIWLSKPHVRSGWISMAEDKLDGSVSSDSLAFFTWISLLELVISPTISRHITKIPRMWFLTTDVDNYISNNGWFKHSFIFNIIMVHGVSQS